jgi:hypothetical protein
VHTPADVKNHVDQAKANGRNSVLVLVVTDNGERFVALKIDNA